MLADAFGIVAMVAMMPLLSIQMVGLFYEKKRKHEAVDQTVYGDEDIVELWEVSAD